MQGSIVKTKERQRFNRAVKHHMAARVQLICAMMGAAFLEGILFSV
jgi:hypothetical protein